MKHVKVVVLAGNANGSIELLPFMVTGNLEKAGLIDSNYHLDAAIDESRTLGYSPQFAFDEYEPAFKCTSLEWNNVPHVPLIF